MKITFGKYSGQTLEEILNNDPNYIIWLSQDTTFEVPYEILSRAISITLEPDYEQ